MENKDRKLILSLLLVSTKSYKETVKNVQKTITELSKIAPLIYEPANLSLQNTHQLFADTQYHLLPEGRNIRSEQIVKQVKPILESK